VGAARRPLPPLSQGGSATNFSLKVFEHYLFYPAIVHGAEITIVLAALSQLIGVILGVVTALGRLSHARVPVFRWIAGVYIWLFRGTPLLIQIIFVYFAIPQLTNERVIISEFPSALIALSLNEGAYMAEIVRAGITSVDAGQMEAAQSLGMTHLLAMRRVVLPQAIRFIIPPTGNEFISMLKNTSLAYAVGAHELLFETQQIISATFNYFELLAVAALWYLAMTTVATYFQSRLEAYFGRGFTRTVRGPGVFQRAMVGGLRRG
jgi:polar amino acid transport system permease protein